MVGPFLNTKNGRTVYCEYKHMVGPFMNTIKWPVRLFWMQINGGAFYEHQ